MGDVEVNVSGPLFDGRAAEAVRDFCEAAKDDIAQQGRADWMRELNANLRHPTPRYELQINVRTEGNARVVNDRRSVYGPWLEGTGSRNSPVTRFPGYRSADTATADLKEQATGLAERLLEEKYLRRME